MPRAASTRMIRSVLGREARTSTLLVWLASFVAMAASGFASSWTPRLLQQSGFSVNQGISAGVLLNTGGAVGALLLSLVALRVNSRLDTACCFGVSAVAFMLMTPAVGSPTPTLIVTVLIGIFANACVVGLYAVSPDLYQPSVRAGGVGWAAAAGRIGQIISPSAVGFLGDRAWSPGALFAVAMLRPGVVVVKLYRTPPPACLRADGPRDNRLGRGGLTHSRVQTVYAARRARRPCASRPRTSGQASRGAMRDRGRSSTERMTGRG